MAFTTPGTAVAGDVLTAAFYNVNVRDNLNALPRGFISVSTRSTNFAPTTTISDLFSVTFTAVAGRNYRYSLSIGGADSSGAILLIVQLTDGSNVALNSLNQSLRGPGLIEPFNFITIRQETAGSITRKIRMLTTAGNASMCSATEIGSLVVEDIGLV